MWVALAESQHRMGLFSREKVEDLRSHMDDIDLPRALEIEAEIGHDVMAEIKVYAEQCPAGGGIIHLGATSADITDNADVLRIGEALDLAIQRTKGLLESLAMQAGRWSETPCVAFTHLQRAEITTIGYRMAVHLQEVWEDFQALKEVRHRLRGKGFKGAVGTCASYVHVLGSVDKAREMEKMALDILGLEAYPATTQVYPRRQDWEVLTVLAGLAGSLYRLAFSVRLLQSPLAGEWSEPFLERQVGSSAMPFKRNPVRMEKVASLARMLPHLAQVAWDNAAHSLLERTLDDSANRREMLPTAFLAVDEMLRTTAGVISEIRIDQEAVQRNLALHAPFAATEAILMEAVKAGGDRQTLHEALRELSLRAWEAVQAGMENPLPALLLEDPRFSMLDREKFRSLFDMSSYVGAAPQLAREMSRAVMEDLERCEGGT